MWFPATPFACCGSVERAFPHMSRALPLVHVWWLCGVASNFMRLIKVVGSKSKKCSRKQVLDSGRGFAGARQPTPTSSFLTLACSSRDSEVERGGKGLLLQKIIADFARARHPLPTSSFLALACSRKDSEVERGGKELLLQK